jgi:hypothetical protein
MVYNSFKSFKDNEFTIIMKKFIPQPPKTEETKELIEEQSIKKENP